MKLYNQDCLEAMKDMADNQFELAIVDPPCFGNKITLYTLRWNGMLQHDMKNKEKRIHPTQKPIKLYEWLLMNYAKEGDKILDTHLGSGSIAIACHNLGYDLTGYEIDKEYYKASIKRIEQHKSQLKLKLY
jgi:site-specific DNA-methyltransferase (adenine-specific)